MQPIRPHDALPEAPASFPDFAAFLSYLETLGLFRMRPGLERLQTVLGDLGLTRPPYTVVQVVGTNGKGSTSTMLANLAQTHGLHVGLHTSPHFLTVRERVRFNGAQLPEKDWLTLANRIMRENGAQLSYFEFITCLAVLAFAEYGADLAVMETGLGGTFDATTALAADLVLFTPIALDHQTVLGPTLKSIAVDKAGAIRTNGQALTCPQQPDVLEELLTIAEKRGARLEVLNSSFLLPPGLGGSEQPMRLNGPHQLANAKLALAAWRHLVLKERQAPSPIQTVVAATANSRSENIEAKALAKAWLPGRMQRIPAQKATPSRSGKTASTASGQEFSHSFIPCALGWPSILLDGAHNSHGLAALGLALARVGLAPGAIIFSCLADKNPEGLLPHLRSLATGPVFVPPIANNPRAMPADELAALIGINACPAASLEDALRKAATHMAERLPEVFDGAFPKNPLLICGSLYLLGEFYALRPQCLEESG